MERTLARSRGSSSPGEVIALDRRPTLARPAIRLVLAHSDGLVRAGLRALLEREADVAVVGEAACGEEAIAVAGELAPDVVVMDMQLPGVDALRATRHIVRPGDRALTEVLMLGGGDCDGDLFSVLRAGARGILAADADPVELLHAVRSLSRGGGMLSPSVARRLIDEFAAQPDPRRAAPERLAELTAREREVMGLVAFGLTNDEIAARLVLSPATVKTHVSRAMLKLHARDRAQLVVLAYQTRLVEPRCSAGHIAAPALLAA